MSDVVTFSNTLIGADGAEIATSTSEGVLEIADGIRVV